MGKLVLLLQSRKFWSLILSLVTVFTAYNTGNLSGADAVNAAVVACAAFSIATGIEDGK